MKFVQFLAILALASTLALTSQFADACSIFTVVRDGQVLMCNNEDFVRPGVVWFVPAAEGRFGRVNVGFDDDFAQGSMNEKGLSFDGAALPEISWQADPNKPTPANLIEVVMNECATVAEAIQYFETQNCTHLANAQIMFADATGDSAVITWLPEKGLSVVRINGDHLVVANERLEASGYRGPRFVRAEQVLAARTDASLETMTAVMSAIHQHGPGAFTTYSTVYDLKNKKMFIYNLANFDEVVEFELLEELKKGSKLHKMRALFENSPSLRELKKQEQRTEFNTAISLDATVLDRYAGTYSPVGTTDLTFRVERDGNELRVINPGQPDAVLFAESNTLFRVKPDRGQVTFTLDEDGTVEGLILHKQIDLVAKRVSP